MIEFTDAAREWMDALDAKDRQRLDPVLELFDACTDQASADYYNPHILVLSLKGQPALALSPRKQYLSFYAWSMQTMSILKAALPKLGKANPGVGCLRFRKPADLNMDTLAEVFKQMNGVDHEAAFGFQ